MTGCLLHGAEFKDLSGGSHGKFKDTTEFDCLCG